MNPKTEAKYFAKQTLDGDGVPNAARAAAVCEYIDGLKCSDTYKTALLKAYKKAITPLLEKEMATAEISGEISAEAVKELGEIAKRERGGRPAKIEIYKNPKLLGGVRLKLGDTIIELSLRQDLEELSQSRKNKI